MHRTDSGQPAQTLADQGRKLSHFWHFAFQGINILHDLIECCHLNGSYGSLSPCCGVKNVRFMPDSNLSRVCFMGAILVLAQNVWVKKQFLHWQPLQGIEPRTLWFQSRYSTSQKFNQGFAIFYYCWNTSVHWWNLYTLNLSKVK